MEISKYLSFIDCDNTRDFIIAINHHDNVTSNRLLYKIIQSKELETVSHDVLNELTYFLSDVIYSNDELSQQEMIIFQLQVNTLKEYIKHLLSANETINPILVFKDKVIYSASPNEILTAFIKVMNSDYATLQLNNFNSYVILDEIREYIDMNYHVDSLEFIILTDMLTDIDHHLYKLT